ncbi:MAG: methylamine dehydrogenase [Pseudomonadota bacterium]
MTSLLIAHASVWLLIGGLAVLALILARQLAALDGQVAPAGALAVNEVLDLGAMGPVMALEALDGSAVAVGGTRARSQLLLFLAPDCPISASLAPVLGSLSRTDPWLDVVLISDGAREDHQSFSRRPGLGGYPYLLSEALGRACGVGKVPYAVLLDEAGMVAGYGIVNSREHLESLFEAKETGVPSIQAFMADSPLFHRADGSA